MPTSQASAIFASVQLKPDERSSTVTRGHTDEGEYDDDESEHKRQPRFAQQRRVYAFVSRALYGSPWPRRCLLAFLSIMLLQWSLHVVIHTRAIYNKRERRYTSNVQYIKDHCKGPKEIENGSVAMENCEEAQLATSNYLLPSVAWEAMHTELDELFSSIAFVAMPPWLAWVLKYTAFLCCLYFWITHGVIGGCRVLKDQWALFQLEGIRVSSSSAYRSV